MALDDGDAIEDGDGGGGSGGVGKTAIVCCSICLESVTDNGERSWAKLQCGHEFHLDCIGSAFNIKGAMQCPNCRKIEKGQWLYATGSRSFADFIEEWPHDEDLYDLTYSEMFGLQWCPLPAFSRLPSFEEGEFPSTAYHDLMGQHAVFAEHAAVSSSTHQCPYFAYYGPVHSSSSSSVGSASDGPNFSNRWGGPSGPSEILTSYGFGAVDPHYHGWEHHSMAFSVPSTRLGGSDQSSAPTVNQRPSRSSSDQRSGSFLHPFGASHSSGGRVGTSVTSSMVPPYPGSAARARDRVQALQAYFQPPSSSPPMRTPMMPGSRRSTTHRGLSQGAPLPLSSDQAGGFYVFPSGTSSRTFPEVDNSISNRFNAWERDPMASFQLTPVDRDPSWASHVSLGGYGSFRQWHGSDRTPPQNRP